MILSVRGEIITWNITTGKLLNYFETGQSFETYKLYGKEENSKYSQKAFHYDFSLLQSREELKNVDEKQFFESFLTEKRCEGQDPFSHNLHRKFFNFKLIKIVSPYEISVERDFTWPVYNGIDFLLFSDDMNYMYEELKYKRVFFYQWVGADAKSSRGKFQFLRRIIRFPTLFEASHNFRSIHSPQLTKYIDWDD
jgi:hypothetical protein